MKLDELKRGDMLKVTWLDASTTKNVSLKDRLPNRWVETPMITFGEFVCVQKGKKYGMDHLILLTETKDESGYVIVSIPTSLIVKLEKATDVKKVLTKKRYRYRDGSSKIPLTDSKEDRLEVREVKIEREDWRGIIASILGLALIVSILLGNMDAFEKILYIFAPVMAFYFYSKHRERKVET